MLAFSGSFADSWHNWSSLLLPLWFLSMCRHNMVIFINTNMSTLCHSYLNQQLPTIVLIWSPPWGLKAVYLSNFFFFFFTIVKVMLQVLYKLKTAKVFERARGKEEKPSTDIVEEDPFAIQTLSLCPESRMLCVAGVSAHVIIYRFSKQELTTEVVQVGNRFLLQTYNWGQSFYFNHYSLFIS